MERTKFVPNNMYDVQEEPIVLSKYLIDLLLKEKRFSDCIALYTFYYYTAKWQRTDQPRATVAYVAAGIGWGTDKVQLIKARLKELGLIEEISQRGADGKLTGHFVRVNFIWHSKSSGVHSPPKVIYNGRSATPSNALRTNNGIFDYSPDNLPEKSITPKLFEEFWKLYPRKASKGASLTAWTKLCHKPIKDRPTWHTVKKAILHQSKSDRWQDPEYIPHASTWLNQSRWLDDPKEMKRFNKMDLRDKRPPYKEWDGMRWYLNPADGEYYQKNGNRWID